MLRHVMLLTPLCVRCCLSRSSQRPSRHDEEESDQSVRRCVPGSSDVVPWHCQVPDAGREGNGQPCLRRRLRIVSSFNGNGNCEFIWRHVERDSSKRSLPSPLAATSRFRITEPNSL